MAFLVFPVVRLVPAAVVFVAAYVGSLEGKSVLYYMKIFSADDVWNAVTQEVNPVFGSVQWKLYQGG